MRKLIIGALNIKTHPHSPENYANLFKDIFLYANSVKIRGTDWGTTGWMKEIVPGQPIEGLYGELYKFLNINPLDPWFDQRKREVIEITEGNEEPPVPEHLKPNLTKILFAFYPKKHRFIFDTHKFSPNLARKLLLQLFSFTEIHKQYGDVNVEVESSSEAIESILLIPSKSKLEIRISLPNPDDISDEEQRVIDRLNRQNARTVTETLTSTKDEGLLPDEQTITLMRVAKSNGYVNAVGYEGDKRIEKSTLDHPLYESVYYDAVRESRTNTLLGLSAKIMASIARQ